MEGPAAPARFSEDEATAFDRAIAHAYATFAGAASVEELRSFLSVLRECVNRIVNDGHDQAHVLPPVASAERIIELVRRNFIDQIHAGKGLRARAAIDMLAALGQLQHSMPEVLPDRLAPDRSSFGGSVGLSVEIAHDMRSPLTAILFLLDAIRSGRTGPITPAQARQLGIAYGAALGLSQMATNLIDHARGNARIIEAEPVPFSVNELLYAVRDILAPVSEERGLAMHVETLHDHARTGFPTALHRILLNLATNAVKYTRQGTVTLTARALADQRVEFAVADTGPGMPEYVQAQLFQPFRLTPTSARPTFSSSGLGLSICHDLATALGSTLSVSTRRGDAGGGGTKFWFAVELPIAPGT